ncbi:hypothetical protein CCACVL1_19707 [Corchorus capsularis]|uniref:Uncharacterized protein n=1 Tax=Corchorus capsularis TaxID=210143 RepID=A0A1R3HFC7_COCAP|nr:hypothetical protein CCACVL1_19707 [Corchorus capsularis]
MAFSLIVQAPLLGTHTCRRMIIHQVQRQERRAADQSHFGSETDEEDDNSEHKNARRSSRGKGNHTKSLDVLNSFDREENGKETDGGHWQAFQNFLLRDAEEGERRTGQDMFSEKEVRGKRRPNRVGEDPLLIGGREVGQYEEGTLDMHNISASGSRMPKAFNDQSLISGRAGHC